MSESFTNVDNSSTLANSLFTTLTTGTSIPVVPDFSADKFNYDPATDATAGLYDAISGATIAQVTEGINTLEGAGAFDVFMQAMDKHLDREFKNNRITADQYAEVYTAISTQVMSQAVAFTLQKDQAHWNSVTAQMQARIAEVQATAALVELEKTKIETSQRNFELNLTAAQYAQAKMQIATEEARHDGVTVENAMKQYQVNYLMPSELAIKQYERQEVMPSTVNMNKVQTDRILPAQAAISEFQHRVMLPLEQAIQEIQRDRILPAQADMEEYRRDFLLPVELGQQQYVLNTRYPAEVDLIEEQMETQRANTRDTRSDGLTPVTGVVGLQKDNLTADEAIKQYNLNNTLPTQLSLITEQVGMVAEQTEAERAKTLDTRSDGVTAVVGSMGKQKDLYTQQIDAFVKDAQHKTAKMWLDGWITQKTLDEGLTPPSQLNETNINSMLTSVRTNNSL